MAERKSLGRGLSALLGEDSEPVPVAEAPGSRLARLMPIEFLHPGRYQPRHRIDEEAIEELAESIRTKGILQPLLVRQHPDEPNAFEIIAGERRWRAAQRAQLHEVPVIVKELSDREALEIALVENLQRQDLNALEEAEGYRRLMDEFSHTQEELARAVGKSRSHVANAMRLLGLPTPVKEMLETGKLSAGHARALLNAHDPVASARHILDSGFNVRQTEKLVQKERDAPSRPGTSAARPAADKDPDTLALERDLSNLLGLNVEIRFRGGGGTLMIHYGTLEQLDDVLQRLTGGAGFGDDAGGGAEEEGHAVATPIPHEPAINIKLKPVTDKKKPS